MDHSALKEPLFPPQAHESRVGPFRVRQSCSAERQATWSKFGRKRTVQNLDSSNLHPENRCVHKPYHSATLRLCSKADTTSAAQRDILARSRVWWICPRGTSGGSSTQNAVLNRLLSFAAKGPASYEACLSWKCYSSICRWSS